jgi:hypothetical protein
MADEARTRRQVNRIVESDALNASADKLLASIVSKPHVM